MSGASIRFGSVWATVGGMERFDVVISGFDAYKGVDVNPSREVAQALARDGVPDPPTGASIHVTSVLLPMSFAKAWPLLLGTIDEVRPRIVIATGLKRASRSIALERCATNIMDADKPDADNAQPRRVPIEPGAPAAYWTQLPLRGILNVFAEQGIPATLSSDAGTYVCNSLFYRLLNWSAGRGDALAGFVSFPTVNESGDYRIGIPLGQMITATQDVVRSAVEYCQKAPKDALERA
ncbi:pyroglutamyl-peptidase [Pseudoscardovia suis]|uniref:Pyroglutamyl-peptidase I n=2 Tax=Pseudoscardovia suis TaxID=987063 RepID=A0A261F3M7_9BIFI|nr:peptidase C15 [Pseudoscardovia suis]PJJ68853.1 pyroglutamyl-peptidase [Pseudoscardovia suis]